MPGPKPRDLFDTGGPPSLTVTQVNQRARQLLEREFSRVTVVGEVSNHKIVRGHHYFSLRDDQSQLPAVLFQREANNLTFQLRPGVAVIATGRLTIYPNYGRYQIVVDRLEPRGAGALQAAFEELKSKLAAEGLFEPERKRPLPRLPSGVAVVTSPTGAVIRDIVNVATRRFPNARILVVPTRVQGADAAADIAAAVGRAAAAAESLKLSSVIVARGGGSLEDLWGFNDERVARAIAGCPVPVVSGVGHETDFTIADFVADVRAPTPSAAAELIFPVKAELLAELHRPVQRAGRALRRDLSHRRQRLTSLRARLGDGRSMMSVQQQRLSYATLGIQRGLQQFVSVRRLQLSGIEGRLQKLHPRVHLRETGAGIRAAKERLLMAMRQQLARRRDRVRALDSRLQALSPLGVLERGYAIVLDDKGSAVRDAVDVSSGDRVDVRVARGRFGARVEETEPEEG